VSDPIVGINFDTPTNKDFMMRIFVARVNPIFGAHLDWDTMSEEDKNKMRLFQANFKWPEDEYQAIL
jgi:hypothetical protein